MNYNKKDLLLDFVTLFFFFQFLFFVSGLSCPFAIHDDTDNAVKAYCHVHGTMASTEGL